MIPKLATLAVSAALAASMAAPVTAFAKDGVYTASSVGRNGSINVQVTKKMMRLPTSRLWIGLKRILWLT